MSDSEAPAAPEVSTEVSTEDGSPAETPDRSSPTTPDNSTDVAPTRKARRRPEIQPVADVKEKPKVEEQPAEAPTPSQSTVSQGGWGYWGSWGKTILSTATATVATVGQGLTQVIEKAETSLGIPSPTELSARVEEEQKEQAECREVPGDGSAAVESAFGMLSSLTSVVQSTALEILSRESESKVKSVLTTLSGDERVQLRADLELIKESFSLVEFDDEEVDEKTDEDGSEFERELTESLEGLSVTATAEKLSKACRSTCSQITDMTKPEQEEEGSEEGVKKTLSVEEVHAAAIRSLAELTARSIELFHKLAEMILFSNSSTEASALSQLTVVLCKEISLLSKKFTSCLTTAGSNEKGDVLNPLITGVFLEASNSASYIQDAFQLLRPIVEISHIQRSAESTEQ
ncbi:hypothetical protein JOQ06_019288 [Pogonophryne albipinna]|uniref:Protein FAM114A2 n=1 Tax=Pogonophryne albipinna TaxID=1090488 RepID=A0AAD6FDW8_9TELE|nr:hypothetical protein JOQ06_019288 [Pogonophryne albipinna]